MIKTSASFSVIRQNCCVCVIVLWGILFSYTSYSRTMSAFRHDCVFHSRKTIFSLSLVIRPHPDICSKQLHKNYFFTLVFSPLFKEEKNVHAYVW